MPFPVVGTTKWSYIIFIKDACKLSLAPARIITTNKFYTSTEITRKRPIYTLLSVNVNGAFLLQIIHLLIYLWGAKKKKNIEYEVIFINELRIYFSRIN
jgi:hypothetical protein